MENTIIKIKHDEIKDPIINVLRSCYDPEIPVDIYEMGLIYEIEEYEDYKIQIKMTLTSPACPVAGSLPPEVENKIRLIKEIKDVKVEVVWEPPWEMSKMSEAAKFELGMM